MLQQLQNLASYDITQRPPLRSRIQFLNFVNKIFVISRLITKFTKILCHENLELYGIPGIAISMFPIPFRRYITKLQEPRQELTSMHAIYLVVPEAKFGALESIGGQRLPLHLVAHVLSHRINARLISLVSRSQTLTRKTGESLVTLAY